MPLEFTVFHITNRSQGGDPGYAVCNILEDEQRDFGPAVQIIELTLHHEGDARSAGKIKGPVGAFAAITGAMSTWPPHEGQQLIRFERTRKRLVIEHIATRLNANEACIRSSKMTRDVFSRCFDDAIDALKRAFAERIKDSDEFDQDACLAWVKTVRDRAFPSDKALQDAAEAAWKRTKARYDAKDPWDKLDIDWDAMHPDARSILDDPKDWSQGHEFSPHGNDAGADILADWDYFRGLHPFDAGARMELPRLTDDLPDYLWKEWVDVHLAMAFGHIKKEGLCPTETASATIAIIDREVDAKTDVKWEHRDEWLEWLARYRGILERYV